MRERTIPHIINDEIVNKNIAVIMEEIKLPNNQKTYIPSSLNQIIYKKYINKSINNAMNLGGTICEFLNYVSDITNLYEDDRFKPLKELGLMGLNFYHLSSFLNYCVDNKKNSYDTIKQKELRLFNFYDYLIKFKLLNDKNVRFNKIVKNSKIHLIPDNAEDYQVSYPSKYANKVIKLKNLEEYLYQLLIELSEKYTPDITFGVVLQIMGGIRKGELVNLRFEDVLLNSDKNRMDLIIKKRPELFMGRNINISSSDVKKPRKQVVFNIDGSLYEYYKNHLNYRTFILNKKNAFSEALMIDKDGQSMTGSTYSKRFYKLKEIFLNELEEHKYSIYIAIKDSKWGTHICRGIFTNLCIKKGLAKNIRDLANLRGDWSEDSSRAYWDASTLAKSIEEKMNILNNFEALECE